MADKLSQNRKNHLSLKDVAKRTAALTLLLSTVACSSSEFYTFFFNNICWTGPLAYVAVGSGIIALAELFEGTWRHPDDGNGHVRPNNNPDYNKRQ